MFIVLCVLEDPNLKEQCAAIDCFSQIAVKAKENTSKANGCLFSLKELSASNCTEAKGRKLQDVTDNVHCKSLTLFNK